MIWEEWKPLYEEILHDMGYDEKRDKKAAEMAAEIKKSNVFPDDLKKIIYGKIITICGAGENLEKEIKNIEGIIMAADEATSLLLSHHIYPHIITTDLDGNVEDIIHANERGSIVVIHTHGDNLEAVKNYLHLFNEKIMITTQTEPFDGVYNFGGFTDGDRAYCIARHFGAREIKLVGFDFEKPREKKGKNMDLKKKKLRWAKKIIEREKGD